jgi:hypothetical protein
MALFGPLLETLLQTSLIAADPTIGHNNKMTKDRSLQWKARAEKAAAEAKKGCTKLRASTTSRCAAELKLVIAHGVHRAL